MKTIQLIFPLIALIQVSCIGGGVVHSKKQELVAFKINKTDNKLLRHCSPGSDPKLNPTKAKIISLWGDPDSKVERHNREVWTYDGELSWRGLVPMAGIGIPLVIPAGRDGVDLYFLHNDTRASKAIVRTFTWSGGYYGPRDGTGNTNGFHKLED